MDLDNCLFLCNKKFIAVYRNPKRELNDIRFEFAVGKDSAEGIAAELVGAGLVDGRDIVVIAANLQKLIDTQSQSKTVTFPLVSNLLLSDVLKIIINSHQHTFSFILQNSGYASNETPDDKALIGFAQISITD